jgi:hypothetical protein
VGLWSQLFGNSKLSWEQDGDRSLVDEPKTRRKGRKDDPAQRIDLTPWSATRLAGIFKDLQSQPNGKLIGEARRARQCLSRFWLQAPVDQLEGLYRSPVGQCYRMLLKTSLAAMPLLTEEQQWRDGLAQKLSRSMSRPERVNLLLAAMPYFERGKMRLMNATDVVPQWLIADYSALFDPGLARLLTRPAGLLGPAGGSREEHATPESPSSRPDQRWRRRKTTGKQLRTDHAVACDGQEARQRGAGFGSKPGLSRSHERPDQSLHN